MSKEYEPGDGLWGMLLFFVFVTIVAGIGAYLTVNQ